MTRKLRRGPRWRRGGPIRLGGLVALMIALGLSGAARAAASDRARVALFGIALVDSSLEGEMAGVDAAEAVRLELLDDELKKRLRNSDRLEVLPLDEPVSLGCRACELDSAAAVDADFALAGWVQKVSDLILNINLRVTAVGSGQVVFQDSVDIRGNTDQSWLRGLRYLVDRRLLAPPG